MMRRALVLAVTLLSTGAQAQPAPTIEGLSFMSGCWTTPKGAPEEYRECYTAPYAGMIQGSSQTVKDQKTVSFEFSVISEKDGQITYAPFFKGKALSVFTLTTLGSNIAVFENAKNDFPKKVIYWRDAGGSLVARIEGNSLTDKNNKEWAMVRQGP